MKTIEITEVNEQEYYDILNNENPISGEDGIVDVFKRQITVFEIHGRIYVLGPIIPPPSFQE